MGFLVTLDGDIGETLAFLGEGGPNSGSKRSQFLEETIETSLRAFKCVSRHLALIIPNSPSCYRARWSRFVIRRRQQPTEIAPFCAGPKIALHSQTTWQDPALTQPSTILASSALIGVPINDCGVLRPAVEIRADRIDESPGVSDREYRSGRAGRRYWGLPQQVDRTCCSDMPTRGWFCASGARSSRSSGSSDLSERSSITAGSHPGRIKP